MLDRRDFLLRLGALAPGLVLPPWLGKLWTPKIMVPVAKIPEPQGGIDVGPSRWDVNGTSQSGRCALIYPVYEYEVDATNGVIHKVLRWNYVWATEGK